MMNINSVKQLYLTYCCCYFVLGNVFFTSFCFVNPSSRQTKQNMAVKVMNKEKQQLKTKTTGPAHTHTHTQT